MKWALRIVAVLVALPLLAAVVLWAIGMRSSAGQTHSSIEIRATPQQIWPWISQGDRQKQWVSWLLDVRDSGGAAGGAGSQHVWVMRDENNGGATMEIPFLYTEYVPPAQLTASTSMAGLLDGRESYRLTDLGNGRTRVDADGRYQYRMWMARLMEPLITSRSEAKMNGDLARLKEMVEKSGGAVPQ